MSHQTGIHCNEELLQFISKSKTHPNCSQIRLLKISIHNEELTLDEYKEPNSDWEEDYQRFVKRMVLVSEPCYILFRLDSLDANGTYEWLFILWTPEESSVRQKMLYASTKATLKMEFGGGNILYDYFATNFDEINFNGFKNWLKSRKTAEELPLTREEQELKTVRRDEAISSCITKTNKTLPGLEFPIDDEAINALFDLKDDNLSYVQLSIDIDNEEIKLDNKKANNEFDVKNVRSLIPDNSARYHLIVFRHTFDGQFVKSIVFVYSIPGNSCSVKQRMLYSSCKSALLNAITDRIGIQIDKKLEIDNPRELTLDFLIDELHPKVDIVKNKFDKPKGPTGKRGAKRIIKTNGDE
jgi:twinfilin-like protein